MGFIKKKEEKVEEKKEIEEPTREFRVVKELPMQPVKEYKDEEQNKIITFLTWEEAMEMILNQEER